MKYEAVFGDQTWFDDGPDDAEMVAIYALHLKRWYKMQDGECYLSTGKEQSWERCSNGYPGLPLLAQRRIIRVPIWTKADQQAGKLPPVGSTVWCDAQGGDATVIAVDSAMGIWFQNAEDEVYCSDTWPICPVETDAERQQREREEWCRKALDSAGILSEMKRYDLKRLGKYIGSIHDALLSGTLSVPTKGNE